MTGFPTFLHYSQVNAPHDPTKKAFSSILFVHLGQQIRVAPNNAIPLPWLTPFYLKHEDLDFVTGMITHFLL